MTQIQFDYFRGMEAEQYSFYRVPKLLFTEECFRSLSCEAKVLYGLMLDRMGLSIKNRWLDEQDRIYIIFTVEEIMELLGCGRQKAVRSIAELDIEKGIGLIEKRRLGLGRPNVIYVKNFMVRESAGQDCGEKRPENPGNIQKYENHTSRSVKSELQEVPDPDLQKYENHTSGSSKIILQEVPKSDLQKYENHISGSMKNELAEVRKSYCNNTDINDTDINDTEYSDTDNSETDYSETDFYRDEAGGILSIHPKGGGKSMPADGMEEMALYRRVIREKLCYENFGRAGSREKEIVDELVELMVEVMTMPDQSLVRIGGVDKPAAVVKNRFMQLDHSHMEYVLISLRQNTAKVGNIRAYLLTALYNAPLTIGNYYQAEANHDLHAGIKTENYNSM